MMDFYEAILANKLNGSGGGGGSWELLGEKEETLNVTSSSNPTKVSEITISGIATSDKLIYVDIRDKAGKRDGYFYESVSVYITGSAYGGAAISYLYPVKMSFKYANSAVESEYATGSTGGWYTGTTAPLGCIFAQTINAETNTIAIQAKNTTSSGVTVNGTYSIKVYAIDFPVSLK